MKFLLTLKGQELTAEKVVLAEHAEKSVFCSIDANDDWDGLAITLIFRNINALDMIARKVIVTDRSAAEVPASCLRDGYLFINAIGVADGGVRLTTADMQVGLKVDPMSALDAPAANPVTPDEYDQLLALVGDLSSIGVADTTSIAVILQLMAAQIGDMSKLDTDNLADAIEALPQYRPCAPEDYECYISHIVKDGFYAIYGEKNADGTDHEHAKWLDRPAEGGFVLVVLKYTGNYVMQIAFSQRGDRRVYSRIVNINDYSLYLDQDWTDPLDALPQYRGATAPEDYNYRIANIVKDGSYAIYGESAYPDGDWQDRPAAGGFVLDVRRYTANYNMQLAISQRAGGEIYNRIVSRIADETGNYPIHRDWVGGSNSKQPVILAVGDSICRGYRNGEKGFVGELGMPYINLGVSGATLSTKQDKYTTIPEQLINADMDADIIIANGGVNDYWKDAPMGSIPSAQAVSAAYFTEDVLATALGGLERLLFEMHEKYPLARKFFLLSHKTAGVKTGSAWTDWTTTANGEGYTQTELFESIKAVCKVYNVEVIDVFGESEIDTNDSKYLASLQWNDLGNVTKDEFYAQTATDWVDGDGVHPLAYGYRLGYLPVIHRALFGTAPIVSADDGLCTLTDRPNPSGENWRQLETAAALDEPYLGEWGWKCSVADGTEELYRWIYRCLYEGFDVPTRSIQLGTADPIVFQVDAGAFSGVNEKTGETVTIADTRKLCIPLCQFGEDSEDAFFHVIVRVLQDSPILCRSFWHPVYQTGDDGMIMSVTAVVPDADRTAEMREICEEEVKRITDKVFALYGISPGDALTDNQRAQVAKLIHDCIILHVDAEASTLNGFWLEGMMAIFDARYRGLCGSFTQAFNYVARLYGMEALYLTGMAYIKDFNADGDRDDTGEKGSHAWVALRLSGYDEYPYGTYPADSALWTSIDVYWDEPWHESNAIGEEPEREDVLWKYFMDLSNINMVDAPVDGEVCRVIGTDTGYGAYPFDGIPTLDKPYTGDDLYIWNEEDGL